MMCLDKPTGEDAAAPIGLGRQGEPQEPMGRSRRAGTSSATNCGPACKLLTGTAEGLACWIAKAGGKKQAETSLNAANHTQLRVNHFVPANSIREQSRMLFCLEMQRTQFVHLRADAQGYSASRGCCRLGQLLCILLLLWERSINLYVPLFPLQQGHISKQTLSLSLPFCRAQSLYYT